MFSFICPPRRPFAGAAAVVVGVVVVAAVVPGALDFAPPPHAEAARASRPAPAISAAVGLQSGLRIYETPSPDCRSLHLYKRPQSLSVGWQTEKVCKREENRRLMGAAIFSQKRSEYGAGESRRRTRSD